MIDLVRGLGYLKGEDRARFSSLPSGPDEYSRMRAPRPQEKLFERAEEGPGDAQPPPCAILLPARFGWLRWRVGAVRACRSAKVSRKSIYGLRMHSVQMPSEGEPTKGFPPR